MVFERLGKKGMTNGSIDVGGEVRKARMQSAKQQIQSIFFSLKHEEMSFFPFIVGSFGYFWFQAADLLK